VARERDEAERAAWRAQHGDLDPADLVFVDESATPLTLTRTHARAPKGRRALGRIPRGQRPAISLLAALTHEGPGTAVVVPGAIDGDAVVTFVEQILVPSLRPGQVVVLDNLSVHKSARARQAIEAAGCQLLFLPRYSPDFNPIEQAFSKLKAHLRAVAARTFEAVVAAIGAGLAALTPADCRAFFAAAGYPPHSHSS
jgi:transposase